MEQNVIASSNEITSPRRPMRLPNEPFWEGLRGAGRERCHYLKFSLPHEKWSLGDRLFIARVKRREHVENVALMHSISTSSLQKYERAGQPGGVYPPAEKLVALCDYYELDPGVIFTAIRNDRTGEG